MCDYPLKYIFSLDKEQVSFDAGCDCVTYSNIQPRSWGDLAEHYNMQTSEEYIAEMDEFWGFQELEAA